MTKICVFAGTTEGRKLTEFLRGQDVAVRVCVATDYGQELLPEADNITVSAERLPEEKIRQMLQEEQFDLVIDATHPYAAVVTDSIRSACAETGIRYLRLLREAAGANECSASVNPECSSVVYVADTREAARFLESAEGNILLTTGSKEIASYRQIPGFEERVYARILPMESSLAACRDAGMKPSHILAMQGPFSLDMNVAMLGHTQASWMVTKDSGEPGGFQEKADAAARTGASLLVIGRPLQEEGIGYEQMLSLLCKEYGCRNHPAIIIAGIGPGNLECMTRETLRAIEQADCLIGAGRMLKERCRPGQGSCEAIAPEKIVSFMQEHPGYQRYTALMSGDTGFFSGTKKLLESLAQHDLDQNVKVLPGLSSLSVLCSRLKTSYEDVRMVSLHGRETDIAKELRTYPRVFTLVGGEDGIARLCTTLTEAGLGDTRIHVGERLSYEDEKITSGICRELKDHTFHSLSAALLEREESCGLQKDWPIVTPGLPDSAFLRGEGEKGIIPMTKSEIRALCLSKLQLSGDSVCWDIGAGSGSVAIEMARLACKGHVYAIERDGKAIPLIRENQKKLLFTNNLTVIEGIAPKACCDLPAPTHAFIGGSTGNMNEILQLLLEKNAHVRIVAAAVSLETIAELTQCMKSFSFTETEVTAVNISTDRKAGAYHLMNARNPVFIFMMQR